jgi:hypothetical protein
MLSKRVVVVVVALCCLFALTPSALFSQSATTGAVTGIVTDPTGSVVPGAAITLTQLGTNVTLSTITDSSGRYLFPAASPGQYSLKCTGKGFRTATISQVQVEVLKSSTLDIKLELGAQCEVIEVVAATGAELQTTDASIGTTFSGDALLRLPAQQRSITAILLMQPGVSPAMPAQNKDDINGGQVAGALPDQTTFFVDGGDATSDLEGTNNYVSPPGEPQPAPFIAVPAETVQEFRLVTASPTANFSRSQGGEVAVLTKSGTNSIHGSAYEYYYGSATSANDWQLNSIGRHRPHSVNNRFGTSVGAPILKNKLFIFGNYEGRRFHQATTITQLVPTDSARQGKIILQDNTPALAFQTYSLTPGSVSSNCGSAGTSTCDPRGLGMDPLIQAYFKLLPEPNNFSVGDGTKFKAMFPTGLNSAGFTSSFAQPVREDIAVARLDYVISPKWNIFGTYHYNRYRLTTTNQFDITAGGTPHLVSNTPVEPRLVTFMLEGTVGSHFTSQTHGSYMRDWWAWGRQALAPQVPGTAGTLNLSGEARLANTGSTNKVWGDPTNFDTQDARSRIWFGRDYYAAQDSTWVHGTHTIQFGGGYWFWNLVHSRTDIVTGGLTGGPTYYVGETQFNGGNFLGAAAQRPPNLSSTNGKRFANMYTSLLGLMDHSAQIGVRDGNFIASPLGSGLMDNVHTHTFETYVQDSWKIRRSLTLTYGLSYGVQFAPTELNGKQVLEVFAATGQPLSNLNAYYQLRNAALSNGGFYASGLTSTTDATFGFSPIRHIPGRSSSASTHWNNLGPRVAVAWQVPYKNRIFGNGQTVIRGGYSILWNRTSGVQEALTPLLGDGLASKLQCNGPTFAVGSTTATCSNGPIDATNGFRLGVDGNTAPIPPALNAPIPLIPSSPFNGGVNVQDPGLKLPYSHNVTLDVQRAFAHNMLVDVGYIGRFAKNLWYNSDIQSADMFAKTPACTAGSAGCNVATSGQTLWQAYNAVNAAVNAGINPYLPKNTTTCPTATSCINPAFPLQPFFENSTFGCANCTNVIANLDGGDVSLSNFMLNNWDLKVAPRPLDPLQLSNNNMTTSGEIAYYHALFVTFRKTMSQGLDMSVNYTWSHALGNGGQNFIGQEYTSFAPPTPFDLNSQYASNNGDRRHVINASAYYLLPFGKGRHFTTSNGILDRVIGGWYVSGIWTFETGLPFCVGAGGGDYGAPNGFTCAIGTPLYGKAGLNRVAGSGATGLNLFADPAGAIAGLRAPVPGVDGRPGGEILNLPHAWNFDFAAGKNMLATERYKVVFSAEFFNTFNHPLFGTTPGSVPMDITVPGNFGSISKADNLARQIQFGLRVEF